VLYPDIYIPISLSTEGRKWQKTTLRRIVRCDEMRRTKPQSKKKGEKRAEYEHNAP
jgi:hypothetical protein